MAFFIAKAPAWTKVFASGTVWYCEFCAAKPRRFACIVKDFHVRLPGSQLSKLVWPVTPVTPVFWTEEPQGFLTAAIDDFLASGFQADVVTSDSWAQHNLVEKTLEQDLAAFRNMAGARLDGLACDLRQPG